MCRSQTRRGRSSANSSLGYRPESMSRTASSSGRVSVANGAARRTVLSRSSTVQSSIAVIATTCWASTSSGFAGTCSSSMAPVRIRSTTTAAATRSPRYLGNRTPRETAPTWCPALPTRCRPAATLGGASTWTTRSTEPMSIPSSRLEVATTAGSRPAFSSPSMRARCSLLTDPWCALASTGEAPRAAPAADITSAGCTAPGSAGRTPDRSSPGRPVPDRSSPGRSVPSSPLPSSPACRSAQISFSRAVSRSASRRELAKTSVDRWLATRSVTRSSTCGQIEGRWWVSGSGPVGSGGGSAEPGSARSGTGTTTRRSNSLSAGGATVLTLPAAAPPSQPATASSGRTVADSPTRCAGRSSRASSRSRLSARWAPRFEPASTWTSSRITVRTPASADRDFEVSSRKSDSGVVMRMSGGVLPNTLRSCGGVSPDRTARRTCGGSSPSRAASLVIPVSGERRLRCTSTARALSGET